MSKTQATRSQNPPSTDEDIRQGILDTLVAAPPGKARPSTIQVFLRIQGYGFSHQRFTKILARMEKDGLLHLVKTGKRSNTEFCVFLGPAPDPTPIPPPAVDRKAAPEPASLGADLSFVTLRIAEGIRRLGDSIDRLTERIECLVPVESYGEIDPIRPWEINNGTLETTNPRS
jgi:hypothetical protein